MENPTVAASKTQGFVNIKPTYLASDECNPHDTVSNGSFNDNFANWTVVLDPAPEYTVYPATGGDISIQSGTAYPDNQVIYGAAVPENLLAAWWQPTTADFLGNASATLTQWVPVCPDTTYYFEYGFTYFSTSISGAAQCYVGSLLDDGTGSISDNSLVDWTQATLFDGTGNKMQSNFYDSGSNEFLLITIELYCDSSANIATTGRPTAVVDAVVLETMTVGSSDN